MLCLLAGRQHSCRHSECRDLVEAEYTRDVKCLLFVRGFLKTGGPEIPVRGKREQVIAIFTIPIGTANSVSKGVPSSGGQSPVPHALQVHLR